ncbi:hypothetical protein I302_105201 [Kwoniella bestiolae CBS 10118]|uniref:Uncharacterized protein n=1 Tax=Kwoniella bestiolae CBS 10118 TaxID=1296100 RepID=A0A1B9FSG8_9TREE|nr:hypothetical protein I302_08489 [Kwoniella bestiolae CBS 10118]OCF21712.1 hypothetical protein I302_08489 [Kwoniella bestiolae CBS 10118]
MLASTILPFLSGFFLKLIYRQQCPDGLVDCYNTLPALSDIYHHVIDPVSSFTSTNFLAYHDQHFVYPSSPAQHFVNVPMSSMIHFPQPLNQLQFVVELPGDMGVEYLAVHPTLTLAIQPTSTQIIATPTPTPNTGPMESNDTDDDKEDPNSPFKSEGIEFSSSSNILQSLFSHNARAAAREMMSEIVESYASHPVDTFHDHLEVLHQTIGGELRDMKVDRDVVLNVVLGYWLAIATMALARLMIRGLGFIITRTLIRIIKSIFRLFGKRSDQTHNHGDTGRSEIPESKAKDDLITFGETTPPSTEQKANGKSGEGISESIDVDTPIIQRNSGIPITPFTPTPLKRMTSMPSLSPTTDVFSDRKSFKPLSGKERDLGMDVPDLALAIPAAVAGSEGPHGHDSPGAEGASADFFAPYLVDTSPAVEGHLNLDDHDETSSSVTAIHSPPRPSALEYDQQDTKDETVEVVEMPRKDNGLNLRKPDPSPTPDTTLFNKSTGSTPTLDGDHDDVIEETEPQPSHSHVSSNNRWKPHNKYLDKEPQPSHSELPKKRRKVRGKNKSRSNNGGGKNRDKSQTPQPIIPERGMSVCSEVEVDRVVLREEDEGSVRIFESGSGGIAGFDVEASAEVSNDEQKEDGEEEEEADDVEAEREDVAELEELDCKYEKSEFEDFDESTASHLGASHATIDPKGKQREDSTLSDLDSHLPQDVAQPENVPTCGHKKKRGGRGSGINKQMKKLEEKGAKSLQIDEEESSTMGGGGRKARRQEEEDEAEVDGLI